MTDRQALLLSVSRFGKLEPGQDRPPGLPDDLPHATELADRLARVLESFGYTCSRVRDPQAAVLGDQVAKLIANPDCPVRIVHVISHGRLARRTGVLRVLGSDALTVPATAVNHWLEDVDDDDAAAAHTLFLIDTCHSGRAARLEWQPNVADGTARGWVIAASTPEENAYDGRFTEALVDVLGRIARGEGDFAPSLEYVPLETLGRLVGNEVAAKTAGSFAQDMTDSLVSFSAMPELPFFRNPSYVGPEGAPAVEDLEHFRRRASGLEPVGGKGLGMFSGRARELRAVKAFLADGEASNALVTGAPGSGKSALLGVLVLSSHPRLRSVSRDIWSRIPEAPGRVAHMLAVHARQLTVDDIVAAIARQEHWEVRAAGWDVADLVRELGRAEEPAVLVLDAFDESVEPSRTVDQLLEPLSKARRPDGAPVVKLVIGSRTGEQWPRLTAALQRLGVERISLDDADDDVLREDLADYLRMLLQTSPDYDSSSQTAVVGHFADTVASELVLGRGHDKYGPFLVGGMVVQHLLGLEPARSLDEADVLLQDLPQTLHEVLELDLRLNETTSPWIRPVLHALAHARGDGMPLPVAGQVALLYADTDKRPTPQEIRDVLEKKASVHLSTATDTDGTLLHRLFHQGLADSLLHSGRRRVPTIEALIVPLLAGTVPVEHGRRRWDLAPPYLLRHLAEHAAAGDMTAVIDDLLGEPEFLVHASPRAVRAALWRVGEGGRVVADVYEEVYAAGATSEQRRQLLSVQAAREGLPELAADLTAGRPDLWRTSYASGRHLGQIRSVVLRGHDGPVGAVAGTQPYEDTVLAVSIGRDATLRRWDLVERHEIGEPLVQHARPSSVACPPESELAVVVYDDGSLRVWDVLTGEAQTEPVVGHDGEVNDVACAVLPDDSAVAVTVGEDGTARVWSLPDGQPLTPPLAAHDGPAMVVACTSIGEERRPVAVTGGEDRVLRLWSLPDGASVEPWLLGHEGPLRDVSCPAPSENRSVAVSLAHPGEVIRWDLRNGKATRPTPGAGAAAVTTALAAGRLPLGRPVLVGGTGEGRLWVRYPVPGGELKADLVGHRGRVNALTLLESWDSTLTVSTGDDGTIRVWDLSGLGARHERTTVGAVTDIDLLTVDSGAQLLGTTHPSGHLLLWELEPGRRGPPRSLFAGDEVGLLSIAGTRLADGRDVAVTGDRNGRVRIWDLEAGAVLGEPLAGHSGAVTGVSCVGRPDGAVAVSIDSAGTVRAWDLESRRPLGEPLTGPRGWAFWMAVTVLPGETPAVVTAGRGTAAQVWPLGSDGFHHHVDLAHPQQVTEVACSVLADGMPVVATGSSDGVIRIWRLESGSLLCEPQAAGVARRSSALSFATLPRGDAILASLGDDEVLVWDARSGEPCARLPLPAGARRIAAMPEGVLVAFEDDFVQVLWPEEMEDTS